MYRSVDDPERSVENQGRYMRPAYRSVEQSKYKDNHNQILAMVSNQGGVQDRRMQAVSQEPSRNDLYSNRWEQPSNIGKTFDEGSVEDSVAHKKKKFKVKRKPTLEAEQMDIGDHDLRPIRELPKARLLGFNSNPIPRVDLERVEDSTEQPISHRLKPVKKLLRPKKKITHHEE